jgi:hypothetical protein
VKYVIKRQTELINQNSISIKTRTRTKRRSEIMCGSSGLGGKYAKHVI